MSDEHLPNVYLKFRDGFPGCRDGPGRPRRGRRRSRPAGRAHGAPREAGAGHRRRRRGLGALQRQKGVAAGATADEVRQVALLAITTCGFPLAIAGAGWIDEVLDTEA